jgi:hypothetical protein
VGLSRSGQTAWQRPVDPGGPARGNGRYVTIPIVFWSRGWLLALSPTGTAVLFALTERLSNRKIPMFLTRFRRESYGPVPRHLDPAGHVNCTNGLLTVSRVPQGGDYDYRRLHNSYWIDKERLLTPPS